MSLGYLFPSTVELEKGNAGCEEPLGGATSRGALQVGAPFFHDLLPCLSSMRSAGVPLAPVSQLP